MREKIMFIAHGYMDWAGEQKCCPKGHWAAKEQHCRSPCSNKVVQQPLNISSQTLLCEQVLAARSIVRLLCRHFRLKDKATTQANLRYCIHSTYT